MRQLMLANQLKQKQNKHSRLSKRLRLLTSRKWQQDKTCLQSPWTWTWWAKANIELQTLDFPEGVPDPLVLKQAARADSLAYCWERGGAQVAGTDHMKRATLGYPRVRDPKLLATWQPVTELAISATLAKFLLASWAHLQPHTAT